MDRPPPDPEKLLDQWMEWERGETTPGRVMANLKTGGLRDLLEAIVNRSATPDRADRPPAGQGTPADAEWEPSV